MEAAYSNTSTPIPAECYIVSINNLAGEPRALYLTLLPASQGSRGLPELDPAAARLPIDYTLDPPVLRVLLFKMEDVNGDGVEDVVGAGGTVLPGSPWLPSCSYIQGLSSAERKRITLPYQTVATASIEAGLSGASLDDLAKAAGVSLPSLPLWRVTLEPQGKVTLFVYAELPVTPRSMSILALFQFGAKYYIAGQTLLPLPPSP